MGSNGPIVSNETKRTKKKAQTQIHKHNKICMIQNKGLSKIEMAKSDLFVCGIYIWVFNLKNTCDYYL